MKSFLSTGNYRDRLATGTTFCLLVLATVAASGNEEFDAKEQELFDSGWQSEAYKTVDDAELKLWYKKPADHDGSGETPAIVFFYGGGWRARNLGHFQRQGEYLAERGMVAVLADYRARSRYGGTPFDCVEDAKSALRYVRSTAAAHGIDPDRIAVGGGSAGGHLAAATALVPGLNADSDDLSVSCVPDALVLFNPAYGDYKSGYGFPRFEDRWDEIAPIRHVNKGAPPNIVFLGDKDRFIPVSDAETWKEKMEAVGVRSELHIYEGRVHGFFNSGEDYDDTLAKTDEFLVSLGYLDEK